MSVELNILEYDLEGAADCHYDYLEVCTRVKKLLIKTRLRETTCLIILTDSS